MRSRLLLAVLITASVAGCGTARDEPVAPTAAVTPPVPVSAAPAAPSPSGPAFATPSFATPAFSTPATTRVGQGTVTRAPEKTKSSVRTSDGWEITVYYTAVERFHGGESTEVTGCPRIDCTDGDDDLGSYPASFVEAVEEEGTGRTTSGKYLNWSYDVGFWLDTAPRTSAGDALKPWVSAAADSNVLSRGTRFTVSGCGTQEDGSAPAARVCAAIQEADWLITDEFTPGLGGPKHIDAYIGPETGPNFTDSAWYLSLIGARLTIG